MSISIVKMFAFIFKSFSFRSSSIIIISIILSILLLETLIICNLIPFWSSGGLLVGLDEYYNPITDYFGSDGLFSYTKSLCLLNLNNTVLWLALRMPYTTKYDCQPLVHFNGIWHSGNRYIPYFWVMIFFWCFSWLSLFIMFSSLFKFKSKIFCFIGMVAHICTLFSTFILVTLFFVSIYKLFIKYMQDSPIFYINFSFVFLHSILFISLLYILINTVIRANKYRISEYETIN